MPVKPKIKVSKSSHVWYYKTDIDKLDELIEKSYIMGRAEFLRYCLHVFIKSGLYLNIFNNGNDLEYRTQKMAVKFPAPLYNRFKESCENAGITISFVLRTMLHEELKFYSIDYKGNVMFLEHEKSINYTAKKKQRMFDRPQNKTDRGGGRPSTN